MSRVARPTQALFVEEEKVGGRWEGDRKMEIISGREEVEWSEVFFFELLNNL